MVKIWAFKKCRIQKFQKRSFQKLYANLVFEFLFDFFSKNQPIDVKSVEEYNFNLIKHNIYAYSLIKIKLLKNHLSNFRSLIDL